MTPVNGERCLADAGRPGEQDDTVFPCGVHGGGVGRATGQPDRRRKLARRREAEHGLVDVYPPLMSRA